MATQNDTVGGAADEPLPFGVHVLVFHGPLPDAAELAARIQAALRRDAPAAPEQARPPTDRLVVADLELDPRTRQAERAGHAVSLSPTESRLLHYLMANSGRVVSKAEILDRVWHGDHHGRDAIVESYISYLRRKIDAFGARLIHTVRGMGYVLR